MASKTDPIFGEIADFIKNGNREGFGALALRVFGFQYHNNPVYQAFCEGRGLTPETVGSWKEIPVVPTEGFKVLDLSCGPSEITFLTSGTSQNLEKRGRHHIMSLDLYRTSILGNFSANLLPDGSKMKMLVLTGSPETWKHSSLSHMMEVVREEFGAKGSYYYINESGLEEDRLIADLKFAIRRDEPVFLLGVTLAFHQLLERFRLEGIKFSLPTGSRVMDTGGFKGRDSKLSKETLYAWYQDVLGIPSSHIVNEYGMTEMGSQFYENTLRNFFEGRSGPRVLEAPHWVRTTVVDPETLQEVPEGQTGILRHYDLANCGSVMALQTDDLGRLSGAGFKLTGRAEGAEARGCSLLMEDLVRPPKLQ